MKFKAAIFDLDGTLIDSTWVWYVMMEKFSKDFNIKQILNCIQETAHMPPSEFIEFIRQRYSLKQSALEIKDKLLSIATEFYSEKVPLKKGVVRFLQLLKQNEIKMSIATSCFVELTEIVLKKWQIYDMFSHFLYSEELKTNKRSADIYLLAAKKMGVSYEECAVFEDILLPLQEVKAHNMGYFAVEDDRRSEEIKNELKSKSDCYIKDYDRFIDDGYFEKFFYLKGEGVEI